MQTLLGHPVRTSVVHPGDRVDGRYLIKNVIATGGMGTVFLAEHTMIKRRLALKVLHPELASDIAMVQRFLNEASAAGTLGHPNIVESTDMGFTPERVPFIVFEYLEGALLTEEVYRVRGMSPRRALRIAVQIASALDAAHAAGIVHLDLKSDNVFLIDRDGGADHVKVLDFGIAKFMEAAPDHTQRNLVMGTPEFMSPEQITAPDQVDARADIWALGVVLYEMLTAKRPYNMTDGARILLHRIVHETTPAMNARGIPPELERMIMERMLAKNPADRFSSMRECREALETLLHVLASSGDSIPPPLARASGQRAAAVPTPVSLIASGPHITIEADEPPLPEPIFVAPPAPPRRTVRESEGLRYPPAPVRRRWPTALLALALVAGAGGGGLLYAEHRMVESIDDAAVRALDGDAAQLATLLDTSLRSAKQRGEVIASAPLLRNAIETDAATIIDAVRSDGLLVPGSSETIELFQQRDGRTIKVLREPEDAPSLGVLSSSPGRLDLTSEGELRLVATTPITERSGKVGGAVAVAIDVDLAPIRARLGADALAVTLTGLDKPVDLLPRSDRTIEGIELVVPVAAPAALGALPLSMHAWVRPVTRGQTLRTARYGAWGISAFLLFGFLGIGALRGPSKPRRAISESL